MFNERANAGRFLHIFRKQSTTTLALLSALGTAQKLTKVARRSWNLHSPRLCEVPSKRKAVPEKKSQKGSMGFDLIPKSQI